VVIAAQAQRSPQDQDPIYQIQQPDLTPQGWLIGCNWGRGRSWGFHVAPAGNCQAVRTLNPRSGAEVETEGKQSGKGSRPTSPSPS